VTQDGQRAARFAALALTGVLGGLLVGYRLDAHPLWDPDEAKHAEVAREMLVEGRLIEPLINFEPYHHKPSALYLAIGAAYRAVGTNELGARLVSACCAWLTLLLVCAHGARRNVPEGLLAALLLGACGLFVMVGRFTNFDAPLTLCTTAAVLALARMAEDHRARDALLFHGSLACAVLVKGPVALVLLAVPAALALWRGDLTWSDLEIRRGSMLMGVVVGAWLVPTLIFAPRYLAEFLWVHNVERYLAPVGADVFHPQPFWFFLPVLAGALLPWSAWMPAAVTRALAESADRSARVLAEYSTWVVIFFSLSSGKLATYILPAVPSLALLTARSLIAGRAEPHTRRGAIVFTGCVCAVLCPAAYLYLRFEAPALVYCAAALLPISVTGIGVALRRGVPALHAAVALSIAMTASVVAFNVFASAPLSPWTSDADLAAKAREYGRPQRVIAYRVRPFSFLFYTGWPMQYHVPLDEVRAALYEPGIALLLTEDQWMFHLEEAAPGVQFTEIARNPRHVLYAVRSPWG